MYIRNVVSIPTLAVCSRRVENKYKPINYNELKNYVCGPSTYTIEFMCRF